MAEQTPLTESPPENEPSPPVETPPVQARRARTARSEDLSQAVLRLAVGSTLEGSEQVAARLRQWQAEAAPAAAQVASPAVDSDEPVLRYLLVGALFGASRAARRRLKTAGQLVNAASRLGFTLLRPVTGHAALRPLQQRFARLVQRGQDEISKWARQGRAEELHSRRMLRRTVDGTLGEAVGLLSDNTQVNQLIKEQIGLLAQDLPHTPQVDALVEKLVAQVITYLEDHPAELETLVRAQGDQYMDHISENPAQVQEIVQGQSTTLADEMSDEVRERMVTADNVFELFIRALLRRPLREELPPPPGEIRQRALRARTKIGPHQGN